MRRQLLQFTAIAVLAIAVAASGIGLVNAEHDSRQLFMELESLNREQDRLQVDWGRLQLEQSTWATHSRIESLASEQLNLAAPKDDQIVVVETKPAAAATPASSGGVHGR